MEGWGWWRARRAAVGGGREWKKEWFRRESHWRSDGLKSRAKILLREKLFSDIGFTLDCRRVLRQCISNEPRSQRGADTWTWRDEITYLVARTPWIVLPCRSAAPIQPFPTFRISFLRSFSNRLAKIARDCVAPHNYSREWLVRGYVITAPAFRCSLQYNLFVYRLSPGLYATDI